MNFHISKIFTVISIAMLAACTDNANFDYEQTGNGAENGDNIVSVSVDLQPQRIGTRGDNFSDNISSGKYIDILIWAVYEKESNGNLKLLEEFQKSSDALTINGVSVTPGKGQVVMEVNKDTWPHKDIRLNVEPDKEYRIVFWAHSSKQNDIFTVTDLSEVKVDYEEAINNDDTRDAFCAHEDFNVNKKKVEVTLKRVFAQINVGCTGWDYEAAVDLPPHRVKYTDSKITIVGVPQYFDARKQESIIDDDHPTTTAEFSLNRMPAFIGMTAGTQATEQEEEKIKNTPFYDFSDNEMLMVKYLKNNDHTIVEKPDKETKYFNYVGWDQYRAFKSAQEFGKYDYRNKRYLVTYKKDENDQDTDEIESIEEIDEEDRKEDVVYLKSDQLFDKGYRPHTEVYKYLSMCYILAPATTEGVGVVSKITYESQGYEIDQLDSNKDETLKEEKVVSISSVELTNVPVQQNWRTNIISDAIYTYNMEFNLYVIPDYCGEYDWLKDENIDSDQEMWKWGGLKENEDGTWSYGDDPKKWEYIDSAINGELLKEDYYQKKKETE